MPITINGSGTVTGITAGGLPDGVITTDDIAANAVTYAKIGTTEQGQLCKAWVNFNGTGTVAIRASYNVSSITDHGPGEYSVNFTSSIADANYAVTGSAGFYAARNAHYVCIKDANGANPPTTSSCRFQTIHSDNSNSNQDCDYVFLTFFR